MFRQEVKKRIETALGNIAQDIQFTGKIQVSVPDQAAHGDYATNIAMIVAGNGKRDPIDVAKQFKKFFEGDDFFVRVEFAGPGFINFTLSDRQMLAEVPRIANDPEQWGQSTAGEGKTVLVEYFQLNIAKRPHVGHLRSAVIGDSLKRMFMSQGYRAVSDTHVGDWGTQFGILLLAYSEHEAQGDLARFEADPFSALEELYVAENARIIEDPSRRDLAKEEFAKLEQGDADRRKAWQWMVDVSMEKLEESARRLGLMPFDEHRGESAYEDAMQPIVEGALAKGVAKKIEDEAVVVDLAAEKLDEAVLIKSDGASTYLLRDLATIQYRVEQWAPWKNLYVVDVRQSHHFRQLFRVAELLGLGEGRTSEHVSFGFMTLPEGAMSTRQGNAISLGAVLDEAEKRARAVIQEKNPALADADRVAREIGLGALKYFDLSHHRTSDVVFSWDRALSFDGNTGPYLQYTHARLRSIMRKIGSAPPVSADGSLDYVEHRLLAAILRFPEAIQDALHTYAPSVLASYLYNLAKLINEFYHSHPVIQESDRAKRDIRALLIAASAATLHRGLWLLGIAAPEEM